MPSKCFFADKKKYVCLRFESAKTYLNMNKIGERGLDYRSCETKENYHNLYSCLVNYSATHLLQNIIIIRTSNSKKNSQ